MKVLAFLFLAVTSLQANAQQPEVLQNEIESTWQYIYNQGRASGFCSGGAASYFCYDQIKRQAKDDAVREASFQCSMKNGRLDQFSASCTDFCTPFSIPDGQPQQFVNCNVNCNSRCEIPDSEPMEIEDNF